MRYIEVENANTNVAAVLGLHDLSCLSRLIKLYDATSHRSKQF